MVISLQFPNDLRLGFGILGTFKEPMTINKSADSFE